MNQATKPATPLHDVVTRPILFSGPMVRALLDGRKTQSRRIVKSKDSDPSRCITLPMLMQGVYEWRQQDGRWFGIEGYDTLVFCDCPYGAIGDRLWVRETWAVHGLLYDDLMPSEIHVSTPRGCWEDGDSIWFAADGQNASPWQGRCEWNQRGKWRPSIHMPRWGSRITLEITDIRVERLNEISEEDAKSEGVVFGTGKPGECRTCAKGAFMDLWNSINGVDSWMQNPWVWVVEFKVV